MKNNQVYPWFNLPWDIALASGLDLTAIFTDLDLIPDLESDERWLALANIEEKAKTEIGAQLWRDICTGKLPVRKSNGDPMLGEPGLFAMRGVNTPHITLSEGNDWLRANRYLQTWEAKTRQAVHTMQNVGPQVPSGTEPSKDWRFQVQEEAYKRWIRLRAVGCNPTIASICPELADWCIQTDVRGDKGQNPRAGTIRNAALGGGKWTPPQFSVASAKKYLQEHPEITNSDRRCH